MHRLEALVHVAILDDEREGAQLLGLETRHHRHVRMIPIAEHPQTLEVGALRIHLFQRIGTACGAKGLRVDLLPHPTMGFLDLHFDGQTMAVPARNVRCVVTIERARFDDDVFQDFVDGMSQMDRAIGVRRPIGQHERGTTLGARANLVVEARALPLLQHAGLAIRKIGLHWKTRVGQINRIFVVSHNPPSTRYRAPERRRSAFAPSLNPRNRT